MAKEKDVGQACVVGEEEAIQCLVQQDQLVAEGAVLGPDPEAVGEVVEELAVLVRVEVGEVRLAPPRIGRVGDVAETPLRALQGLIQSRIHVSALEDVTVREEIGQLRCNKCL